MLLAVPAIMLIAASMLAAFKSGIFISAISFTLSLEIEATFVLLGTPDPDLMLQYFFNNTAAGGVLVIKLNVLSWYTVITTGNDQIAFICCSSVEFLCKLDNIHTMLT